MRSQSRMPGFISNINTAPILLQRNELFHSETNKDNSVVMQMRALAPGFGGYRPSLELGFWGGLCRAGCWAAAGACAAGCAVLTGPALGVCAAACGAAASLCSDACPA